MASAILSRSRAKVMITFCLFAMLTACASNPRGGASKHMPASDKAMIHTRLAQSYLQQKQYAVAKDEVEEALRIDPKHSESHYVMALLMLELQQYELVGEHFEKAVKFKPSNSAAAHDYGTFLCKTGHFLEAIEFFDLAASNPLFENSALSYMRAGECLLQAKDGRAGAYLKKAIELNPSLGPALIRLAEVNLKQRSYLSARAYIERYFAMYAENAESLFLAYQIEKRLKATEMAESYRAKLLENYPGSNQARNLRLGEKNIFNN